MKPHSQNTGKIRAIRNAPTVFREWIIFFFFSNPMNAYKIAIQIEMLNIIMKIWEKAAPNPRLDQAP